jgi:hypothetical protein
MNRIHILHENPAWLPPIAAALDRLGLPWCEWFLDVGTFDLAAPPPQEGQGRCPWTPPRAERPLEPILFGGELREGGAEMWHPHLPPSLNSPPENRVQGSLDPW